MRTTERPEIGPARLPEWVETDPARLMVEARRLQATVIAKELTALGRLLWEALRPALQPVVRRARRARAVAHLQGLDNRLLADIGLRRGDIELAVDGVLDRPRRQAVPTWDRHLVAATDHRRAPANANQAPEAAA